MKLLGCGYSVFDFKQPNGYSCKSKMQVSLHTVKRCEVILGRVHAERARFWICY